MKHLITLLLLTSLSFSNAQDCGAPYGDFEVWTDISAEVGASEPLPENTVLLPENYFSLFRLFFSLVGDLFSTLLGADLLEFADTAFGVTRVTDATSGLYALQIGGDQNAALADLIGVFECSQALPDSFYVDYKHIGTGADTLNIQGTFGNSTQVPFDSIELVDNNAAYFRQEIISNEDTEYATLAIPVVNNMNMISNDTLIMLILVTGDEAHLATGQQSAFIIDNFRFNNSAVLALENVNLSGRFATDYNLINIKYELDLASDYLTIERSMQATGPFEEIVTLASGQETYNDYAISSNTVYYYRAVRHSIGNETQSSSVLSIRTKDVAGKNPLSISPNPVADVATIHFDTASPLTQVSCNIYNAAGAQLATINTNDNLQTGTHTFELSVGDLAAGYYTCQLVSATDVWTTSFVVK